MSQRYYAQITPGLEELLRLELKSLGCRKLKVDQGGIYFEGTRKHLYRVIQWSRLASRVFCTIVDATAPNSSALFERVIKANWSSYFHEEISDEPVWLALRVILGQHSGFKGTGEVESLVFRAI